jgi:uncharacterized membrane protein
MEKNRLEAFSDGVLAIVITIMVLELKVPHSEDLQALIPLWPVAVSYVLSFIYVGIYWNNHHHMMQVAQSVNGKVLWSNLHLLFWLSLLPFTTGWMGENHFSRWPTMLYGVNLLTCAIAYVIFQITLVHHHGPESLLARALGKDAKGKISPAFYFFGILSAALDWPRLGFVFFVLVALLWLVPDQRMEKALTERDK